jgi:hypothetical protein
VNIWQLSAALRRQWIVTLIGLGVVLAIGYHLTHLEGLYYQKVDVIFLAPEQPDTNTFQNATGSLIGTAGIVSQVVGSSASGAAPVSENATLVGTGLKHGYSVRLPNDGGQWAINYTRPVLDVQAVGTSPEEVTATTNMVIAKINHELDLRQDAFGVLKRYRITTRLNPSIAYVMHSTGSRSRTLAASMLLGGGCTVAMALMVDNLRRRRRPVDVRAEKVENPQPVHELV